MGGEVQKKKFLGCITRDRALLSARRVINFHLLAFAPHLCWRSAMRVTTCSSSKLVVLLILLIFFFFNLLLWIFKIFFINGWGKYHLKDRFIICGFLGMEHGGGEFSWTLQLGKDHTQVLPPSKPHPLFPTAFCLLIGNKTLLWIMQMLDPQGENIFSPTAFYVTEPEMYRNRGLLLIVSLMVVLLAKFPYYIQIFFKGHLRKTL